MLLLLILIEIFYCKILLSMQNACNTNGVLLLSGFYKEDIPFLEEEANKNALKLEKTLERNNWISLKYVN